MPQSDKKKVFYPPGIKNCFLAKLRHVTGKHFFIYNRMLCFILFSNVNKETGKKVHFRHNKDHFSSCFFYFTVCCSSFCSFNFQKFSKKAPLLWVLVQISQKTTLNKWQLVTSTHVSIVYYVYYCDIRLCPLVTKDNLPRRTRNYVEMSFCELGLLCCTRTACYINHSHTGGFLHR